ncbi:CAP/Srv2p, putative [Trypanosoma brucei gambiense DAL972]|uniref:G-actin binding protein, putative n=1 Tax=Trypanosoma brucei gambiense (strain MHOM/CI/86/DAL972) TaxID=679716 RepID=D0A444_TRYB9|nr:CAP/Srv2p, putative [Trypanosoma brucei gambiense DAL972]CBH16038.1 CAP/Srv2p, putative [Trypanosoma brucei gambiense DAL972]|eukprot:XP_011778302.1 CAP/Srv2p, putative [Trypanosoma brucei gambiense DAL972]
MPPPPPAPPPPPPPPPPPKATEGNSSSTVGGAASALFAEIRQGGDNITSRLRHVTDDQKAYKQNIQHGAVDFSDLDAKKAEAEAKRQQKQKQPETTAAEEPVTRLEGDKRWVVKHHKGTPSEPCKVTLEDVNMRHAVHIHGCDNTFVEVKGKVNTVSIVSCNKAQVILESVVSALEVLKSDSVDVTVRRFVPTAMVEKSTSVNLFLMDVEEAPNTEIVTACSSAVNVNFPTVEDPTDILERPLPEQFVSRIVRDNRGKYKIETKPNEVA